MMQKMLPPEGKSRSCNAGREKNAHAPPTLNLSLPCSRTFTTTL